MYPQFSRHQHIEKEEFILHNQNREIQGKINKFLTKYWEVHKINHSEILGSLLIKVFKEDQQLHYKRREETPISEVALIFEWIVRTRDNMLWMQQKPLMRIMHYVVSGIQNHLSQLLWIQQATKCTWLTSEIQKLFRINLCRCSKLYSTIIQRKSKTWTSWHTPLNRNWLCSNRLKEGHLTINRLKKCICMQIVWVINERWECVKWASQFRNIWFVNLIQLWWVPSISMI